MSGPIAVVGMGGRFPGSPHLGAYWETIRTGKICAAPVPREKWRHELIYSANGAREANRTYAQKIATVPDQRAFAPEFFGLSPRRAKVMDPQQRLLLDSVRMALEDGGYGVRPFPRERTGVYVGTTVADFKDLITTRHRSWQIFAGEFGREPLLDEEARLAATEDLVPMQAYTMVGSLMNMVAANVSQCFDFGGPAFTVDAACSSALVALHQAVGHLRMGTTDAAVVGGVYLALTPDNMVAFSRIGALSPSDSCRPYDGRADGFTIGEGVGAVILRRLDDAVAAGDRIYAVIRGISCNNDGKAEGPMTPRREGQLICLEGAYADAGVSPRTLGFLEGHGTATPVGDATEIAAFRELLGGEGPGCAVSSVKANIGHSMSAAGIAGLIKASLTLLHRKIAPQAGFGVPRPELEMEKAGLYVPRELRAWSSPVDHPRRAGVNAFGFGGTNVHVVLEEPPHGDRRRASISVPALPEPPELARAEMLRPELVVLSAPTPALLRQAAESLAASLAELEPDVTLADVAFTLAQRRQDAARFALVVRTLDELAAGLRAAAGGAPLPGTQLAEAPRPAAERKVAFLFPGQGLQAPGMCLDLYRRFPVFRAELDRLAAATRLPRPLLTYLYPERDDADAAAALTATEVCQPAVAALGLALARFSRSLGLAPDLVLGHSLGEFSAAAAGGLIGDEDCVRFVAERGRLIAASPNEARGTMTAVAASAEIVRATIEGIPGVVLANHNHPRQTVISGAEEGIAEAERRLGEAGVRTTRLRVSHAFHSPLMAGVAAELAPAVRALPIATAALPVISAILPGVYPAEPDAVRRIFLEHATAEVDFAGALRACAERGARLFLQMGAGSALSAMASVTLEGEARALTLAGAAPDEGATFLRVLGELFALGVPLALGELFAGEPRQLVAMLPPSLLETRALWPIARREGAAAHSSTSVPLDPVQEKMDSKPVKPDTSDAPTPTEEPAPLAALFRQQIAVLDAHLAIIKQQNELLARGGAATELPALPAGNGHPAPSGNGHGNGHAPENTGNGHGKDGNGFARKSAGAPYQATAEREAPPAGPSQAEIEGKVIEIVSRITAHPPARLNPATKLGADLGFDSLMVVELLSGLQELMPEAEPMSRSAFNDDLSIADVARHLARSLGKSAPPPRKAPIRTPREEVRRYAVSFEERPLPAAGSFLPRAPVVLLADGHGVAEALRRRLERRNILARVVRDDPGELPAGATVVDLRALGGATSLDAAALGAATLRAFDLARRLDAARPSALLLAHGGLAGAGLAGFAKALAREWTESRVLSVELDGRDPEWVADRLAGELVSGETAGEVRHQGGQRLVPVLRPAPLPAAPFTLAAGTVVAIAGGGKGLGARLARALARSQARLILLGRSPAGPESEALLADVRAAGGDVIYRSCDVRDPAAVAAALAEGRAAFGPIQMAVHAAGLLDDAALSRKDRDSFARVFDTKVGGALALWQALANDPLSVFLLYASWAGRFGNAHQVDYAAGNHVLGRLAEVLPALRPGVRVSALDLPPWEGSNMWAGVPEPVRAEMRTRGVSFLSDETGLEHVLAELAAAAPSGEALLGAHLPARTVPVAIRTLLSPQTHPYLEDHRLGDRSVLPMAAAVDLLVAAARGTGAAGESDVVAVEDLAVVKGVILADGAGEIVARASAEERGTEVGPASVELLSLGARTSVAYRARVGRAAGWLEPVVVPAAAPASLPLAEFYARHTFHGPRLRAVDEVLNVGAGHVEGIIRAGGLASDPAMSWLLAVDGALQLCAYWAVVHHGRIGLPVSVGEMRLRTPIPAGARLRCRAALRRSEGDRFEGDLDLLTEAGEPLVQIRGFRAELVVGMESPVVDSSSYRIEEFPEVKELQTKIQFVRAAGIDNPYFRTLDACTGATALIDGRQYINFTSYNYVGLSGHPRIADAVTEAVRRYGTSVSASRVTGGQKPIHLALETELAQFLGTEASLVMVGGHATNVSVIGHLLSPEDLLLHDSLAHDSILGGARLAGARRRPFPHNDHQTLEKILREVRSSVRRVLIAVEGVYSMDGDITPLPEFIALRKKYGTLLFVDEAHSLGVLGRTGRGVGEHYDVDRRDVDIWMGTMSKTLASCGGYIAGSAALIEYLKYSVPGFIYSVGMSPANCAAALEALRILVAEPDRAQTCQQRAATFVRLCRERGIDTGDSEGSAVVPCIVGNSYAAIRLAEGLLKRGIHVHPILYPAVAESEARLRFFITAAHSEEQLRYTADALAEELAKLLPRAHAAETQETLPERDAASEVS